MQNKGLHLGDRDTKRKKKKTFFFKDEKAAKEQIKEKTVSYKNTIKLQK